MDNQINDMLNEQGQPYVDAAKEEVKNNHLGPQTKDTVPLESFKWVNPDIMAQLSEENKNLLGKIEQVEEELIKRRAAVLTEYKQQYGDVMEMTKDLFPNLPKEQQEDKAHAYYQGYDYFLKNDAPFGSAMHPFPESLNTEVERFIPTRQEFSQINDKWREAILDESMLEATQMRKNIDSFNKSYMDANRDKITEEIMSGLKDLNEQKKAFAEKYLTGPDKELKAELAGSILSYDEDKMMKLAKSNEKLRELIEDRIQPKEREVLNENSIESKVKRMADERGISVPDYARQQENVSQASENKSRGLDM